MLSFEIDAKLLRHADYTHQSLLLKLRVVYILVGLDESILDGGNQLLEIDDFTAI